MAGLEAEVVTEAVARAGLEVAAGLVEEEGLEERAEEEVYMLVAKKPEVCIRKCQLLTRQPPRVGFLSKFVHRTNRLGIQLLLQPH